MAAGDGLVSMTPSSVTYTGTSASINADGGVDFTDITALALNDVFTSAYDNYMIVWIVTHPAAGGGLINMQLRAAGSSASGANYTYQLLQANNASISGSRATGVTFWSLQSTNENTNGLTMHCYGPALTQPTAYRTVTMRAYLGATIDEYAGTHSLSTAYDGFSVTMATGSGNVHVFGYEE